MKPRTKTIEAVMAGLTSGHGALRLPKILHAIEVVNAPVRGMEQPHRAFIKQILPRIKYFNSDLHIEMNWIPGLVNHKFRRGKEKVALKPPVMKEDVPKPYIRLHYGESQHRLLPEMSKQGSG